VPRSSGSVDSCRAAFGCASWFDPLNPDSDHEEHVHPHSLLSCFVQQRPGLHDLQSTGFEGVFHQQLHPSVVQLACKSGNGGTAVPCTDAVRELAARTGKTQGHQHSSDRCQQFGVGCPGVVHEWVGMGVRIWEYGIAEGMKSGRGRATLSQHGAGKGAKQKGGCRTGLAGGHAGVRRDRERPGGERGGADSRTEEGTNSGVERTVWGRSGWMGIGQVGTSDADTHGERCKTSGLQRDTGSR